MQEIVPLAPLDMILTRTLRGLFSSKYTIHWIGYLQLMRQERAGNCISSSHQIEVENIKLP